MSKPFPGWLAARTVHLAGGCRAFNGLDPAVQFHPRTLDGRAAGFRSLQYGSLYSELASVGAAPIGLEFLSNSLEAKRLVPTNWRTYQPWSEQQIWPCNDETDKWAHIAHAAMETKDATLWDLARRISHQLRVCAWRLYELSEAYAAQLRARTIEHDFRPGARFEDGFTWLGYLAVQVFLVDACVLRDYLAEFFASYGTKEGRAEHRITSMSGLKRRVLDRVASNDVLHCDLRAATSPGGWLFELGAYRDLAVHCVPLARAESTLLAVTVEFPIEGSSSLPSVSLPLPSDPSSIAAERASPKRSERLAQELQVLAAATRGQVPSKDALAYCYATLDALTRLTFRLSSRSPVKPKVPVLTEKDIVGEVTVRRV